MGAEQGLLHDGLFHGDDGLQGLEAVIHMAQLHGVGAHELFIDLQGLNPVHINPHPPDFEGAGIIGHNHLFARFDTHKPLGHLENIQQVVEVIVGQRRDFAPVGSIFGAGPQVFHELAVAQLKGGSVPVSGKNFSHCVLLFEVNCFGAAQIISNADNIGFGHAEL